MFHNIQDLEKVYHLLDKKACQKIQNTAFNQLGFVERTILAARIKLNNGHALAAQKKLATINKNALNESQLETYLNTLTNFGNQNFDWIFNLGHGVLPETNPEMVQYLVQMVKDY